MRTIKPIRLGLEPLEDRSVPSLNVIFSGGNLTLTGTPTSTPGIINITQNASGAFQVQDNTTSLGTYAVTGNITSMTGNKDTTLSLNLAAGLSVPGNVTITTGTGVNNVFLSGNGSGRIAGMLNINASASKQDHISIGSASGMVLNGLVILRSGSNSSDTIDMGLASGPVTTTSDVLVTQNAGSFFLGFGSGTTTVGGNLLINAIGNHNPAQASSSASLNTNSVVNGGFTYLGGSGGDSEVLSGVINGSTTLFQGEGNDQLFLSLFGPATFGGSFSFMTGSGSNLINFGLGTQFNGNVDAYAANGNNTWILSNGFTVLGNMTLTAGNGNNALGTFSGMVGGNLMITLGNGNNSFTFSGQINGSTLSYTAGTGTNSVNINGNGTYNLRITFAGGTGGDSVVFGANASVGAATIDFGPHTGTNIFTPPTTITFPLVLKNFP
jgi:hypothetical protein